MVCMDANENIYTQALGKMLTDPEGLGMVEAVGAYTGKKIGPTYFRGQTPIDGIWTTPDITIANACVMPAGYGIGDHRMFIVDIHTSSLVGVGLPRERRTASRRLNTRLPHVAKKYIKNLESRSLGQPVSITDTPANGETPLFNSTTGLWEFGAN